MPSAEMSRFQGELLQRPASFPLTGSCNGPLIYGLHWLEQRTSKKQQGVLRVAPFIIAPCMDFSTLKDAGRHMWSRSRRYMGVTEILGVRTSGIGFSPYWALRRKLHWNAGSPSITGRIKKRHSFPWLPGQEPGPSQYVSASNLH